MRAFYTSLPQYSYNLAKAKAELAKSAFPNGFTATLPYPDCRGSSARRCSRSAQSLKKLGHQPQRQGDAVGPVVQHALHATRRRSGRRSISWGVDYPDPADALHLSTTARARRRTRSTRRTTRRRRWTRCSRSSRTRRTTAVRAAAIKAALRLAAADVPYIPIWYQDIAMALSTEATLPGLRHLVPVHAVGARISAK